VTLRIRWTERAALQLSAIADHVALTSPLYAAQLVERLIDRLGVAAAHPWSGRAVGELDREDTRELVERPYRIIYRVGSGVIHVLAIVHTRRDFDQLRSTIKERPATSYAPQRRRARPAA